MGKSQLSHSLSSSDVAIIGMAGRFPGAADIDTFWHNLCAGVESISFFSEEELLASGVAAALLRDPQYVRASGVSMDVGSFDASFFGYSPHEAALMDPQQRVFLECAWQALENAGYNPGTYTGLIGVYAGASMNTYLYRNLQSNRDLLEAGGGYHVMVASDKDFLATKASYKLNLRGPSVTVQTACSTSLVAVHLACQSLRNGECDLALAGGVSVRIPQQAGYLFQEGIVLSPDGHCRAFDARAGGTVPGSGAGLVVLKLLSDAVADGDRIEAVIKGSTINNDGSLKAGYTAPNLEAQAAVIAEAQGIAGIEADSITYVEAHGTGTIVGDPIEIAALTKAFRIGTPRQGFCAIGSVKTNIGHLDAAAGVAGLIKTVLALKHKQIPPSLNFEQPNPRIDFEHSPFYVNTQLSEWKATSGPRRAGVSSFGIGGTNAHLVLEEVPAVESASQSRPVQLLVLSAKTEAALETATTNLVQHLEQAAEPNLADVAYTLQIGRKTFEQRRILIGRDGTDVKTALRNLDPARVLTSREEAIERPVVFMFTGQGAQYVGMGSELYQAEPLFHQLVDECCERLQPHLGFDLRSVLYPPQGQTEKAIEQLTQTAVTQPALFVIEYALAKLWMEWGIRPQAMIGHSIGEYVAACLAGVFSLEDALALVATRGRLMQQLPGGAMLSVPLAEAEVQPLLDAQLSIGVINGPARCVVSGSLEALEALQNRLTRQGVTYQRLHTSHAFHSPMMEPILGLFTEQVKRVKLNPPQMPCISNVTGNWLTAEEATTPAYWARHLRQTVRFADGLRQLLQEPDQILLEVGPGRTLTTLALQHPSKAKDQVVLSSLRHPQDQQSDVAFLLTALGKLWLAGAAVDWAGFHAHERRLRVSLPTYPFERQLYWIEPQAQAAQSPEKPLEMRKPDIADWFYVPSWKRSVLASRKSPAELKLSTWLIFADECGLGTQLAIRLEQAGHEVVMVQAGSAFARVSERAYTLNPDQSDHYTALLADLFAQQLRPHTMVHLWSVTASEQAESELERCAHQQTLGFYSLLALAQALGQQAGTESCRLIVISNELQEVTGEETICPDKATVLGPVQIIPHEYPNIQCCSIDVVLPRIEDRTEGLVDQLLAEINAEMTELIIAYRGRHRWVQTFEPVRLEEHAAALSRLKTGGVYLITGGLGGMGLALARHLAETVQARLILTDHSALPTSDEWDTWLSTHEEDDGVSHKIRQVRELEALGTEILAVQADVTDRAQMQSVVTQAQARFGRMDGAIHAAGVPGGGLIQLKTREMAEQVMAAKVKGTLILADALQHMPLDFLVLCSSINSVVSRLGQVDYSAANAFLDAFVHAYHAQPTLVINWETWREVGMAVKTWRGLTGDQTTSNLQSRSVTHPLLDECMAASGDQRSYLTRFTVSRQWVLHEHGVLGKATLPGTTYLEMARAAFAAEFGNTAVEIRDAYFLAPLIVEDDEEKLVRLTLWKQGDAFTFSVTSQAVEGWQEHAKGTIATLEAVVPTGDKLSEIETRCREQEIRSPLEQVKLGSFDLQRRQIPRGSEAQGGALTVDSIVIVDQADETQVRAMEFGPRWHSLKWIKLGPQEGLAWLELPDAFSADLQAYSLHPALLDFATSFLRLFKSTGSYLPLSYKRLRMWRPLPARLYSYVRFATGNRPQSKTLAFDVILLDEHGTILVEIEEFAVMRVDDIGKIASQARLSTIPSDLSLGSAAPRNLDTRAQLLQEDLKEGLSSAEGVAVFERVLNSGLKRVIVSTRDLPMRIEQSRARSAALLSEPVQAPDVSRPRYPRPKLMSTYAAPRNETEQKLVEIWQAVLGIEPIGIHDNFFELGGDSLLVTRIHTQFVERFGQNVSVANLLQYPTIADLAHFMLEQERSEPASLEAVRERTDKQKAALKQRQQKMLKKRASA